MPHFGNPKEVGSDLVAQLVNLTNRGADYTFDCAGNITVMRPGARNLPSRLGKSIIVAPAGAGGQEHQERRGVLSAYGHRERPPDGTTPCADKRKERPSALP